MKKRDINQERLAGRMEIESGTISKLLNGRMRLSDVWLAGFAEALNVEVADLFRDPNAPHPEDLFQGISEENKVKILEIIELYRKAG